MTISTRAGYARDIHYHQNFGWWRVSEHPRWELLRKSLEGVKPYFLEFVQKRILKIF